MLPILNNFTFIRKTKKMKKTLLIVFICIGTSLCAQTIKKNILSEKLFFGFYPTLLYYNQVIDHDKKDLAKYISCEFHPFVAYNAYKNIFIGVQGGCEFYRSNFYHRTNTLKELGVNIRYVLPIKIDKGLLRTLKFYIETGYYRTNYVKYDEVVNIAGNSTVHVDEDYAYDKQMIYNKLSVPIGVQIKFFKNLHFDINWQYNKYFKGSHLNGWMGGFTYYL